MEIVFGDMDEPEILVDARLVDVVRIPGGYAWPASREALVGIVELPLLAAAQHLYDKNLRTRGSSANALNLREGFAWLNLDMNDMSGGNRAIAEAIADDRFSVPTPSAILEAAALMFPITAETTVAELSAIALERAKVFEWQPMTWAPSFTAPELRELIPELAHLKGKKLIKPALALGFYFDEGTKQFWLSEEQFLKAQQIEAPPNIS